MSPGLSPHTVTTQQFVIDAASLASPYFWTGREGYLCWGSQARIGVNLLVPTVHSQMYAFAKLV